MKSRRALIEALLIGILVLVSTAYSISISVSNGFGGFTENINAGERDSVHDSMVIGKDSLSNSIQGSGDLKVNHWVSNSAGASARTGVDIREAESYSYDYYLTPGPGFFWPASKYPEVSAAETVDAVNAYYINAYANAINAKGDSAGVSTILFDPEKEASLIGYTNLATSSTEKVSASQNGISASAPEGSIQTKSISQLNNFRLNPFELRMQKSEASASVTAGSINGYADQTSASKNKLEASQHIDCASGMQINTGSKSSLYLSSLYGGSKKSNAEVSTFAFGSLTGYDGIGGISQDISQAGQTGHLEGVFFSSATAGIATKTRSSNYGDKYDFNLQAVNDATGSSASGSLGYYVDANSPYASSIQGAVDASESGDTINVASGTYYENILIDKSLFIYGAGIDQTIVDAGASGRGFHIMPSRDVMIKDITVQNGYADYAAGIWNEGNLILQDCLIQGNSARVGAGIATDIGAATTIKDSILYNNQATDGGALADSGTPENPGVLNLDNVLIYGNNAYMGAGAIHNVGGIVNINSGRIYDNHALFGGAIRNQGTINLNGGIIEDNSAQDGGGIMNWGGTVNLNGGTISGNYAYGSGGGIHNYGEGAVVNLNSGAITENTAAVHGGGILNWGDNVINGNTDLVYSNTLSSGMIENIYHEEDEGTVSAKDP